MLPRIVAVLTLALPTAGGFTHVATAPRSDAKIDPAVRAAIDSGRTVQVILLGRHQLFAPAGGLDSFARRHAADDRRTLRPRVIDSLKAIATADQAAILRALK